MGRVWSEDQKIQAWLAVEKAACEGWHRRNRIPTWAIQLIRTASCDLDRMRQIERETDHDVIAFLRATGESIGEASRFVHLGLTSSDVVDTGLGMQTAAAGELLHRNLELLIEEIGRRAIEHRDTLTIGRTHGVHAEPTTFGLKLAIWFEELRRHRRRLELAREDMAVGKLSGAVGTHAHFPPDLEEEVCAALGLRVELVSNQIIQRDRHAFFLTVLAGIGGTLEKISVELRHLQRTEVRETQEPFDPGNQGSSAMPHKRNPHASERVTGLARLLRGYAQTAAENVALWHERDISHSSTERVIFPDACIVLDFMLAETHELISGLVVFPERMIANLESTGGLVYSQRVLLALVEAGMDRQDAYKVVQRHALTAWDGGTPFRKALLLDPAVNTVLDEDQMNELFDPKNQLTHVAEIFSRIGLGSRDTTRSDVELAAVSA